MHELPVQPVHPNRPGEHDHLTKGAIELNRPYLRSGVTDLIA
jgi:hypothetical protein